MIKQHIILKDGVAFLADYPNLKAHLVAQKHLYGGLTIEDVAEHYTITRADVHASIAYYYDNQSRIRTSRKSDSR